MSAPEPTREYRRLVRRENGTIAVTITLVRAQITVRWTEKGYSSETAKTVERAYRGAWRAMNAATAEVAE